jgi:uncharacterized protein YbbC (DUF1343 family)
MTLRTGLDGLLEEAGRDALLRGRRYGLLGHGASLSAAYEPAHWALARKGVPASVLFGPEHGYYGVEQDMVPSEDTVDAWTGAPVRSLYGSDERSLRPQPEAFRGLDLLLIDLQDIGTRYYTYAATAVWAARAALEAGVEVWVLDRPNPLGGEVVEGNLIEPGFASFVGALRLPVRHGLTLGELVRLEARRGGWPDGWAVWRVGGWKRGDLWDRWRRSWVSPSPNMPSFESALLYPGSCLLEATTLSEGRGTTRPFRLLGAPGVDPLRLVDALAAREVGGGGLRFVPTYFRPQFHKHAGLVCGGVEIHLTEPGALAAYRAGVELLWAFRRAAPDCFGWRAEPYEFVADRPAIDLLTGSAECRRAIEALDEAALERWLSSWRTDEAAFREERDEALLYR